MDAPPPAAGPAPPPVAPLLTLDLPSHDPVLGLHAQYSVLRPIITVEKLHDVYYVSVAFELEVVIHGNVDRFVNTNPLSQFHQLG